MTANDLTSSKFTARDNPGLQWFCETCEAKVGQPCTHAAGEVVNDAFLVHLHRYNKWRAWSE